VKVTTRALRCIDKAGGVDQYLLTTRSSKLASKTAFFWRRILLNRKWQQSVHDEYLAKVDHHAKLLAEHIRSNAPELMEWKPEVAQQDEMAARKLKSKEFADKIFQRKEFTRTRGAMRTKKYKWHKYLGQKAWTANIDVEAVDNLPAITRVGRIVNQRGVLFRG
jgi:hypothetical protein